MGKNSTTAIHRVASGDSHQSSDNINNNNNKGSPQTPPPPDLSEDVRGLPDSSEKTRTRARQSLMARATRLGFVGASSLNSTRLLVLLVLCVQNASFTLLRRYSLGILGEQYSKYELLLVGEVIKILFSAIMIQRNLVAGTAAAPSSSSPSSGGLLATAQPPPHTTNNSLMNRLVYLATTSRKMVVLALIYGTMNVLSLIALRNIGAGMFTVFAQAKILSTATFSTLILKRRYTWTQWRALVALSFGVLLFSEPIWGEPTNRVSQNEGSNAFLGVIAVLIEVVLSGFASIYFEKVIKLDALQLSIWERNFQLALGSIPVYIGFIIAGGGGTVGYGGGWSWITAVVSLLGAAGGLLVALSIKYGDAILKTLATTGAIVMAALLDYTFLGGPLTPGMIIAGVNVVVAICNYTFDATPKPVTATSTGPPGGGGGNEPMGKSSEQNNNGQQQHQRHNAKSGSAARHGSPKGGLLRDEEEGIALLGKK